MMTFPNWSRIKLPGDVAIHHAPHVDLAAIERGGATNLQRLRAEQGQEHAAGRLHVVAVDPARGSGIEQGHDAGIGHVATHASALVELQHGRGRGRDVHARAQRALPLQDQHAFLDPGPAQVGVIPKRFGLVKKAKKGGEGK